MNVPLDREALREDWLCRLDRCIYSQGYDALASRDHSGEWHYCCLGVACEVFVEHGGLLSITEEINDRSYNGETSYLPELVRSAFGFRSVMGTRESIGEHSSLTKANDSGTLTFPQIARLVRDHYHVVFEV